jgi:hypothetical protein
MNVLAGLSPLEQEAIPHPAIGDSTHPLFVVEVVRESQLDAAGLVEGFQLFGRKLKFQAGKIVLKLIYFARSDNRDYRRRSIAQPTDKRAASM